MTGYDKIKKFVSEVHEINCALTDEIIEFIDEVIEREQVGNVPQAEASAERISSVIRLLPCPFCGRQPKEYWDYKSPESEIYNEGYNITCCVVHITAIFKDEAIEHWNTRQ